MTGSRMIAGMQQVLVQVFQVMPKSKPSTATAERVCWEHRELLDAIRDRDIERARAMIRVQIRAMLDATEEATDNPSVTAERTSISRQTTGAIHNGLRGSCDPVR